MKFMKNITGVSLIIVLLLVISGCAGKEAVSPKPVQPAAEQAASAEAAVLAAFNVLLQKEEPSIAELIRYIDDHITAVSPSAASTMLVRLETVQKARLPGLQDKFGASEVVQAVLAKSKQAGLTGEFIATVADLEARAILTETHTGGYKIETAEGMYFPVIDYAFYKQYSRAVTADIAAFIDIMAVESDNTPVKDAALMIDWPEILKRAMAQEQFIRDHSGSVKIDDMRQLLKRYTAFALYGANNTPLFSYDTQQMNPAAKAAYQQTAFDAGRGSFSKIMAGYLVVLQQSDFRLTDPVQQYRNAAFEQLN